VFADGTSAEQISHVLREVSPKFLRVLFEETGISTVTVVARDRSGAELDRAVTSLSGASVMPGRTMAPDHSCSSQMADGNTVDQRAPRDQLNRDAKARG
jgi:hypothetical protein